MDIRRRDERRRQSASVRGERVCLLVGPCLVAQLLGSLVRRLARQLVVIIHLRAALARPGQCAESAPCPPHVTSNPIGQDEMKSRKP